MLRAVALRLRVRGDHLDVDAVERAQRAPRGLQAGGGDPVVVGQQDAHRPDSRRPPVRTSGILLPVPTVRLDIEYDGGGFRGWARQPGLRTVQGELEAALATVLREEVLLTVAGRTDTGVHALGPGGELRDRRRGAADLARSLNGVGPDDLAVTAAEPRRPTASTPAATPPRAATSTGRWRAGRRARSSAAAPSGGRTASTSTPSGLRRRPARQPRLHRVHPDPDRPRPLRPRRPRRVLGPRRDILSFRITADAFMRNMVRVLVGTMLEVA